MIDAAALEAHFPHRPAGYLDHAATGTVPVEVEAAVAAVARSLGSGMLGAPRWHEHTDDALALAAIDLGVERARLTTLANTSTAINVAARAIRFRPGEHVLTFSGDFPSPRMPWPALGDVPVREVAAGNDRTEALLAAIDRSTRVVSVTHVHATTGAVLDLARLHEACTAADALLVVDGTQAAGLITGGAAHADVYVGATYKWMLAGFGLAVVATSERFDAVCVPGLVGYMNVPPSPGLAVGHSCFFGLAALQAAARVRHEIGLETIREHTLGLVARIGVAGAELGLPPLDTAAASGIVALRVADAPGLVAALGERGVTTATRDGALRLSPYLTTTDDDVDLLLTALAELAPAHRPDGGRP